MKKSLLLFLLLWLTAQFLRAQCLSGHYSIGPSGTDYPGLQEAIDDLTVKGWSDTVYFDIQPGVYAEQISASVGPWSSICFAITPVIFRKDPALAGEVTVNWPPGGNSDNFVLRLVNCGSLEFDSIRFARAGGDPQSGYRRLLEVESSNAVFRNCVFEGPVLDQSAAQAREATASLVSFSGLLTFETCSFEGGSWGLWSPTGCQLLNLRQSRFNAQGLGGIRLQNAYGSVDIRRNRFDLGAGPLANAISLDSCITDTRIAQNHIESTGNCIRASYQQPYPGVFSSHFAVAHNFLIAPAGQALHLDGDVYATLAFNSIRAQYGCSLDASNDLYVINGRTGTVGGNIFDVSAGAALELGSQNEVEKTDFADNCYVPNPAQTFLVHQTQSGQTWVFDNWRNAERERFSLSKTVAFAAPDDLHLATPDEDLNGRAAHFFLYVNELNDIDNKPLPALWPDTGADQIEAPVANADLKTMGGSQQNQSCGEKYPLRFVLHNSGEKPFGSAVIAWSLNGQSQTEFSWQGALDPGASDTLTLAELPFAADTQYAVEARLQLIDGRPDIYEGLNNAAFTLYSDLSGGELTVGQEGKFSSVQALNDRLTISSFCGPVRIVLLPGEHTGSLTITGKHGFSMAKSLEITVDGGDPDDVWWTSDPAGWPNPQPTLRLEGVQHAWIHDLRFSGFYASGLLRIDHSSNVTLENCRIEDPFNAGTPVFLENDTSIVLRNCLLTSTGRNIWFVRNCLDVTAEYCRFLRTGSGQFALQFTQSPGCRVEGCDVLGGVQLQDCARFVFRQNESHCLGIPPGVDNQTALLASTCDSILVANNIFTNTNLPFFDAVTLSECRAGWFAHNTVRIKGAAKAALSVQLTNTGGAGGRMHIRNNILVAVHPDALALFVQNDPQNFVSDHNVFFSAGQNLIAVSGGGSGQGLNDWQNFNGQDGNSLVFNPPFFTGNDLHIAGNPSEIAGKAAFLPGISEKDIDGDPRAPAGAADPGADQFAGLATNLSIAACNLPDPACHALPDVRIKLKNQGPDTLRWARIDWRINNDSTKTPFLWRGSLAPGQISDWLPLGEHFVWQFADNTIDIRAETSRDPDTLDNGLFNTGFPHRMGGNYRVGGVRPDFHSIHQAAEMLAGAGVCADTRFLLRPGDHNKPKFYEAPGLAPGQTILFEPDGPGMQRGEIREMELHGLSQVEFRRLRFHDGAMQALTRSLMFEGCHFTGSWIDYSAGDGPVAFRNCRFTGNSVHLRGDETNGRDQGLLLDNCVFGADTDEPNSDSGDLFLTNTNNVTIRQCQFARTARAGLSDIGGNLRIEQNQFRSMPALTVYRALADSAQPALVVNNFLRYRGYAPLNPSFNQPYLVEVFDCENLLFQHNSLFFEPDNAAIDYPAAFSPYGSSRLRFENNLVKTRGEAFAFNWSDFNDGHSNFNYFDAGPRGLLNGFPSLDEWKALSHFDSSSTLGGIKFEAENDPAGRSGDLHLASDTPDIPLNSNILAAIPTDFDNQLRQPAATATGADEPLALPLAGPVWPGDCNRDRTVSTPDWLLLGVAIGQNPGGPARPDTAISWSPKYAPDWPDSVQAVNAKHADTNGNGAVNVADTMAITRNFSQEYSPLAGLLLPRSGAVLRLQMPAGPLVGGQVLSVPVLLDGPPEDGYGLAFDLEFSPEGIENGSFWVDFNGSWLGAPAIGFYRAAETAGRYPVALVRTNGANTNGFGPVATLHFRVGAEVDSLKINIAGAQGILSDGSPKPLSIAESPAVDVILSSGTPGVQAEMQVWPNPAKERIFLSVPPGIGAAEVRVFDGPGRCVLSGTIAGPVTELSLGGLPAGAYRLLVQGEKAVMEMILVVSE